MNHFDLKRMAREASAFGCDDELTGDAIRRFAELVAAHEREECAKLADQLAQLLGDHGHTSHQGAVMSVAIKIRRRNPS